MMISWSIYQESLICSLGLVSFEFFYESHVRLSTKFLSNQTHWKHTGSVESQVNNHHHWCCLPIGCQWKLDYWTICQRRRRRKCVCTKRAKRKSLRTEKQVLQLELVDMMQRRKVEYCVSRTPGGKAARLEVQEKGSGCSTIVQIGKKGRWSRSYYVRQSVESETRNQTRKCHVQSCQ